MLLSMIHALELLIQNISDLQMAVNLRMLSVQVKSNEARLSKMITRKRETLAKK